MDEPDFLHQGSQDKKPEQRQKKSSQQETLELGGKLSKGITSLDMRLKILEDRYISLRKKTQVTDMNMIETEKELWEELKSMNDDIISLKKRINEALHRISQMGEELGSTATKYDLKVIEKYLDMWQPMDFITRDEFEEKSRE